MNNEELNRNAEFKISLGEIEQIAKHSMNVLYYADILPTLSNGVIKRQEIINDLRKLFMSSLFGSRTIVCVSGLQGVGKTTMMRKFYGLTEDLLPGTLGTGEKLPVIFTEKEGVTSPELYVRKIVKSDGHYSVMNEKADPRNYDNLSKGTDEEILYLEYYLPYKYTYSENVSFMLLPGYEEKKDQWRELIDFAVHSSYSAIFAFNESTFATSDCERLLKNVNETFGGNLVYAITNGDISPDNNESVKKTVIEALNIPANEKDRLVSTGAFPSDAENNKWIEELKNSVEKYLMNHPAGNRIKQNEYIYNAIINIRNQFISFQEAISNYATAQKIDEVITQTPLLEAFDIKYKKKRKQLEDQIDAKYKQAFSESEKILEDQFNKISGWDKFKLFISGHSVQTKFTETRKRIEIALGVSKSNESSIPGRYLREAVESTLHEWETPVKGIKTDAMLLLDTEKEDGKVKLIPDGEKSLALVDDVKTMLTQYKSNAVIPQVKSANNERLMGALVEFSTYYIAFNMYNRLSESIGCNYYEPSNTLLNVNGDLIIGKAEELKKFSVGLAGVIGVDILGDGKVNLIEQLATSMGVAVPVVTAIAGAITLFGVGRAIAQDINRMNCEDFISARRAIDGIYDNLKVKSLETFDNCMQQIKDRIAENIRALHGKGKNSIDMLNALIEITNTNVMLETAANRAYNVNSVLTLAGGK